MNRINAILKDPEYQTYLREIGICEKDRIFCRHNMAHFLDVARLAWIFNLEEHMNLERERIYAAALLHDIGRHLQYREGIPHEKASEKLAAPILERCGFENKEKRGNFKGNRRPQIKGDCTGKDIVRNFVPCGQDVKKLLRMRGRTAV